MVRSINKTYLLKLSSYAKEKAHGLGTTILIVFSLLLLIIGKVNETSLSIFKTYFLDISSSVLKVVGSPVNSLSEGFYKINNLVFLYSENEELKNENILLYEWKNKAIELMAENEELKKLSNLVKKKIKTILLPK